MIYERTLELLRRLVELTQQNRLLWKADEDGWFSTSVDSRVICIRRLYFEATNQLGSEPRFFEFSMPGVNRCFAFGSEGADLLLELLGAAKLEFQADIEIENGLRTAHSLLDQV